jgi:hypothetical protein
MPLKVVSEYIVKNQLLFNRADGVGVKIYYSCEIFASRRRPVFREATCQNILFVTISHVSSSCPAPNDCFHFNSGA